MADNVYDSDDARGITPPLERSKVDLRPYKSPPPPFLPEKSESPKDKEGSPGRVRKGSHRHRRKNRTSIGIELILRNLAPDRPDLLEQFDQAAPLSGSPSEASDTSDGTGKRTLEKELDVPIQNTLAPMNPLSQDAPGNCGRSTGFHRTKAQDPLDVRNLCAPWIPPGEATAPKTDQVCGNHDRVPTRDSYPSQLPKTQYTLPVLGSHPEDRDVAGGLLRLKEDPVRPERNCPRIIRSHDESSTLPSLQSPPNSIGSPDSSRNLPSIKSLVEGRLNEPARLGCSTQSPFPMLSPLDRHQIPPSFSRATSFAHLTPVSSKDVSSVSPTPALSTSQSSFWAPHLNAEGSQSQSPCDTSSHFTGSPATAYPTPIEPRKDEVEDPSPFHKRVKTSTSQNSSLFKCEYPGCTAEPFQTQYLLKYVIWESSLRKKWINYRTVPMPMCTLKIDPITAM